MARVALLMLALGCLLAPLAAEPPTEALGPAVDKVFERWDKPTSPGCAVAVVRDGRVLYERGYGMANLDHNVPITPATVFHVASVSKQFTAAALALLAQQGKLSLDDEVRRYIPELPDFGSRLTLRHLVHHISGLRDQWNLLELTGWRYSRDLITDDDVLEVISRQRDLNFPPGDKFLYSNTGYTLMAQTVKRVSGKSLREFTRDEIFLPLGMRSSFFRDNFSEIVPHQAYGYVRAGDTWRLSVTNFDTVGATSLLTTVGDLARWEANFLEPRVGGPAFLRQLLERGRLNNGEQLDYAFGLSHGRYRGLATVEHSGGDAGYRSHFVRFPEQRFAVAVLCNTPPTPSPQQLTRQIADLYLAKEFTEAPEAAAAPVQLSEQQLAARAGLYWNREADSFRELVVKDGKLRVAFFGESVELEPVAENRFRVVGLGFPVELTFETGADGAMRLSERFGTLGRPDSYERVEKATPAASELAAYAGTYLNEEIDIPYRVRLEEGKLVLRRLKGKPDKLEPAMRDVFRGELGTVRFLRTGNQVSGLVLNTGRIRNFRFRKQAP